MGQFAAKLKLMLNFRVYKILQYNKKWKTHSCFKIIGFPYQKKLSNFQQIRVWEQGLVSQHVTTRRKPAA